MLYLLLQAVVVRLEAQMGWTWVAVRGDPRGDLCDCPWELIAEHPRTQHKLSGQNYTSQISFNRDLEIGHEIGAPL